MQEEEDNAAEETNDDDAVNVEAYEINDKKKDMVSTIEEDNKTLEYKETMNLYIYNISSKDQLAWRPIYEVIDD